LAAVAQHTSTIRLGTAVVAVPLENIGRLAEDAAVLDVLSGGRLELGLGVGSSAAASTRFGLDHATRHAAAERAIDELRDVLAGEALVPPAADLRGRLWWATGNSASVDAAAARGIGVISGRPPEPPVPDDLARYWARSVDEPRVAVSRLVTGSDRPDALAQRWAGDAAIRWASELILQTVPAGRPLAEQLAVMRRLTGEVRPALRTALRSAPELARA
jgi:alkanesulfonate monooxygenase SsuD/methylene tetrahydromethanopterin reductase-like flavin-dependent oxidoreductase (luciferase family)